MWRKLCNLMTLLGLMLFVFGCAAQSPASTPTPEPTSTATASATATATSTIVPSATATSTVAPTATRAPAANTPVPVPTVPRPIVQLGLTLAAPTLAQGEVETIVVQALQPLRQVTGTGGDHRLTFWEENGMWYALQGIRSDAPLGPRHVSVSAVTTSGGTLTAAADYTVVAGKWTTLNITLPPGQEGLLDPTVLNTEWSQLLLLTSKVTPQRYWDGPFIMPAAGAISDHYGTRRSYNGGPSGSPHEGLDVDAVAGAAVVAANTGKVAFAGEWQVRGNAVVVDHGEGVFSGYYHLSKLLVAPGDVVLKGQILGNVGGTGMSTAAHLHWDMVVQSMHTSPLVWTTFYLPKE